VLRVLSLVALLLAMPACAPSAPLTTVSPTGTAPASSSPTLSTQSPTVVPTEAAFNCPVTVANGSTPPGEAGSKQNHGDGKLWTVLWPNETVLIPPDNIDEKGVLWMKFPWWRGPGVSGRLQVVGTRLDATVPPLQLQMSDYGPTGFQASSLGFSSAGCWEVTGSAGSAKLTFVTRVALAG
jgi:hypothetical protein